MNSILRRLLPSVRAFHTSLPHSHSMLRPQTPVTIYSHQPQQDPGAAPQQAVNNQLRTWGQSLLSNADLQHAMQLSLISDSWHAAGLMTITVAAFEKTPQLLLESHETRHRRLAPVVLHHIVLLDFLVGQILEQILPKLSSKNILRYIYKLNVRH